MPKKILGAAFSETELRAREAAALEHKRRTAKPVVVDSSIAQPYMHMTRHQHSRWVERERMRYEAEKLRGNKDRMRSAETSWKAAKEALRVRDLIASQ